MRRVASLLLPLLAACGQNAEEEADNVPSIVPQPITYPDIEANDLYGASCSYASGNSMGAVVIAMDSEAVMKIGGEIRRFALDPQCGKLEAGTGSRYFVPGYVLDLAIEGEGRQTGYENIDFEGSVKLSDEQGRVLYSTSGHVQCGS